jgi:putative SOS response-associated peptidase YedK
MCGRFVQYSSLESLLKIFDLQIDTVDIAPNYNVAPTQQVLAVIRQDGYRLLKLHWGLVPFWSKDLSGAS